MSTASGAPKDSALLELIESLGSLAWRKYKQRYPQAWIDNKFQIVDASGEPPFISFRFEKEDPELIAKIKSSLDSYSGNVEWVLASHDRTPLPGTNWLICPKRCWEITPTALDAGMSVDEYMAKHDPSFGPMAYADMEELTLYLSKVLGR